MWEQIRSNQRRAAAMVVFMALLLLLVGYFAGEVLQRGMGVVGLGFAFLVWVVLTLAAYYGGDQIFLAVSNARRISKEDHPVLHNVVEEMSIASGLSRMPAIYIIDDRAPNAFATGRGPETASVAVTAGLLETLNRDELQGVIAHEMGHVKNRDVLYMMIVGVMLGAIVLMADVSLRAMRVGFFTGGRRTSRGRGGGQAQLVILLIALLLMILAPIIAQVIYYSISRRREYLADASSALFTRYPEGLASALEKISKSPRSAALATRVTAPMFIVNPYREKLSLLSGLYSTHPPTEERVRILRSMAGAGHRSYDAAFKEVTGRPVGVVPAGSLQLSKEMELKKPEEGGKTISKLERVRQTTDMLWKLNNFLFIPCACGTKLKIPPEYSGMEVQCPHCGRKHRVATSAA